MSLALPAFAGGSSSIGDSPVRKAGEGGMITE